MARAKKTFNSNEAYDMPFPTRLRELLNEKKTAEGGTQEDLAEYIGAKRQSISQWQYGSTFPDVNTLKKIADYYNVSADYLLGRTNIKVLEADFIAIQAKTGLSEKAIERLCEENYEEAFKENKNGDMLPMIKNNFTRTVNTILENPKIIEHISRYLYSVFINADNSQNPTMFALQEKGYAGLEYINSSEISDAYLVKVQAELLSLKMEMEKECE